METQVSISDTKSLASATIKAISQFVAEFEGAKTDANVVYMNREHYEAVKEYFPYMVSEDSVGDGCPILVYNKKSYTVLITDRNTVGMAFSFYTDYVLDFNQEVK